MNWDHPSNVMGDRQTLYCVPIPAESQWVKDISFTDITIIRYTGIIVVPVSFGP